MKRIIPLALCFLLVFSFTFTQPVFAEITTITWTGEAGDGLWHTDGNWDLGQKPNDSDLVIIPESADVVYGGGVTSVRLNCAGNLTVSDGALKIIGDSMLTSGKLDGAGDIEILATGKLTWNGGSIEGSGKLILNQSELLVSQPCLERYLVTIGSLSKLSIMSDSLKLTGGAEGEGDFPIQAGQTLELADSESYNLSSLNINNYGTLKVANTCEFVRFNYDFTQQNTGTLEFDIGGPDDFTKLEVGDEAMLYGKLKINMLDGYVPHEGDTFEIITYNKKYGTFSSIVSNIDDITFEPAYNGTSLTLTVAAKAENVCKIGATEYATLDDALAAVQSGETIELLRDIDYVKDVEYDGAIFIDGTDITIDLNGYTLNVNNSRGPGIKVRNGGKVKCINGKTTGSFNVTGYEYGVWAEDAGTVVRVNNITSRGSTAYNYGVLAKDSAEVIVENDIVVSGYSSRGVAANGGVVTVKGDVYLTEGSGESVGLNVFNEGRIVVEGSVNVSGYAVKGIIAESNASIDISGDVTAMGDGSIGISSKEAHVYVDGDVVGKRMGISARKASVIHVAGNVTSTAGNPTTDGSSRGIEINDECQIIVEGNVQSNDIGVNIIVNDPAQHTPSEIYIDGKITAPKYISIWGTSLGYEDYNGITPSGYRIYEVITGDSSGSYTLGTVFVKVEGVIPVAPTAPQDFIATPGDGQVMLSWIPPGNNGGSAIRKYEVSKDDGENWINVGLNTSYTFTGLTNGTEYTFKVWAVNGVGPGAEATVTATPVVPEFAGGSGSEEDPYLIETVNQLDNVRNYLGTEHSDKHFKLNANLNLDVAPYNSDTGWQPIGTSASPFTGTFDGGGHTISGLFANRSVSNYVGLFGYTGAGAEIRDLVLEDVDVTGCYYVGGLVGNNSGEIINVHVSGNVTGEWDTGGLAGCNNNNGTITNSVFTGNVTGNDIVEYGDWTGGLVGYNLGTITRCRADATVVSEGKYVGGLVGENLEAGIITESCATGSVRAYSYTGGLVGSNDGEITACYSTCTVDGSNDVGGLVGGNSGPITDSFAVGLVDGTDRVGGLVGRSTGATVTGCYWDIETSGQSTSACGTSKSTANMKEQATFIGWDFDDVWDINGSDNNGYPFLRWQSFEAVPAVPTEPQNFIAEPGDGQVALSWAAPASDGGSAIIKYQVSKDNGESWTDVEINTYYTFTGLTNGTTFTFKVRAVNGVGSGAEASTTATPVASTTPFPAQPGMLYTWGRNEAGQMGDGTLIAKSIPTPIGTDEDWVAISTGANHTAALKSDGSLLTWGDNHYGKLGDGTEELRQYSPVRIGSDNDWVAVDTGENHTVALKSDGSLWAWGYATGGFGYGGFSIDWNVPTRVAGDSKWIAVSAGSQHTVAIKEDGTLWGWGFNTYGELGSSGFDDYIDYTENPVQISSDRWIEVSAGEYFTVGLKEDGSLWAWGRNNLGQLGDGSVVDKSIPIRIGSDTWLAAVAGADHVIAIKADGSLWAWGGNQYGELGNGSSDGITDPPPHPDPAQIGTDTDWSFVATGYNHNAAIKEDGSLWLWGLGTLGRLGDGTTVSKTIPQRLDGTGTWVVAACGDGHTAAILKAELTVSHTINFYSSGSLYASKTVTGDSALGTNWPDDPTRSGYSFGGWFTGQNGMGTQYTSGTIITADVDLYAKWTYSGSGSGSSRRRTDQVLAYHANVKTEDGAEKALLVTVGRDIGTVFIEEDPWHTRPQDKTEVTIPLIPGVNDYSLGLPVAGLSKDDGLGSLAIKTGVGSVTVPSNMLAGVPDISGSKVEIIIGQGDKENLPDEVKTLIGDRPLISINLSVDGKKINWSNPNAPITVSIPYTPTAEELANPESIVIWYIDGSGNVISVPNGRYDSASGTVTFTTTHLSDFAVAYNPVEFNDVPEDVWCRKAVCFIAAREISKGTGGGNFSPDAKLARGQFIVMLMKSYDIDPDPDSKDNFADAGNTYYTDYLAAAKRLKIASGIGNNLFAPDKEITRQEMFTLLYNALKAIGRLPEGTEGKPLTAFSDIEYIAPWASEAITLLVQTGTIAGDSGKIYPLSISTRAEMAQLMYNLLKN